MKNEVNRTLVVKKKITLFFIILLSFLTLGAWNSVAWGQTYNGGTWYSLFTTTYNTTIAWTTTENPSVFAPTTGTMKVGWKESARGAGFDLWVNDNKIASSTIFEKHTNDQTASTNVGVDVSSVKVSCYCSLTGYFGKYSIPMAKHIRLKGGNYGVTTGYEKNFGDVTWGTKSEGQTVNFRSFLTNGNITVKLTSGDKNVWRLGSNTNTTGEISQSKDGYTYAVGANKFAYNGSGACTSNASVKGKASGYDFVVYFCPTAAQAYSGTITISDGKSSATVTLKGTGIKRNQTLQNFSTATETHKTTDVVPAFAAYTTDNTSGAETNLTVAYSSNNTDVATVDNTGKVTIKKDGTVTFTAKQTGDDDYNKCDSKSVKWTITKVTPTLTAPVISSPLKYNETCPVGAKVKDYWTAGNIAKDNEGTNVLNQNIEGTYSCEDLLLPSKNAEGYLVTFTPTNTDWYNTNTIRIYREVEKGDQYITWTLLDGLNPRDKYYEYATGETFDATSYGTANKNPTGLTVNYSSSNPAFATITDGNKLNVVKSNEVVTITATCVDPAGNWNDAVSVSKTFKTCGAKPDKWSVTASALTYGQTLSESELSGVVKLGEVPVSGTLEWVAPTTLPNAGNHSYSVLFTPENEDAYGSVTFDVPVTVAKADPVITWNIGERLRENSRYRNFVISSNTEKALNISVSGSPLSVDGNVLTTGEVENAQNGWIKVSQPASDNYNAVPEQILNVTINPKSNVCLPLILDENKFNDAKESSVDKVSWCSTNEDGYSENYIAHFDVRYTQRVGIALGSWDEGLSGLSWTKFWGLISGDGFEWSPKSVDLAFTGVPDKISFDVESQKVTSSPPDATWKASATDWYLYESADGVNYTQVGDKFVSGHQVRNRQLKVDTRYIRIKYSGNFTGFVKNLQITQKKYLNVDKPTLTFGTEANPLQEPQTIKLSYASLGYCGDQNSKITVTSSNPAFYVDESEITENVDIDQMGEYTIRVRCNDVNQTGTLTIEANDGTKATVNVHSTKPDLTTAHTETLIFQTGTEHAVSEGSAYRTQQTHNFTACFNGGNPIFDTLYIYGVSESAAAERLWEMDALKGYKVPALNVAEGNVHTPCFVYAKSGAQYEYIRTFDAATGSLDIDAAGKKLGFIGYKPVNETVATPAIQLSGATEIYLNNAEIASKGSVMVLNGANTIYARGNNTCSSANAAAIQLGSSASALTIEDSWAGDAMPGNLALIPAAGKPSIDLNGANNVTINGTQLELHNAVKMAIVHMDGNTEKTDGSVKINDGTITGESSIGLPQNTIIDGGTFNDGTIVCYNHKGKTVRPFNSRDEVLARAEKEYAELPDWYGKSHLVQIAGRVYPMLYGGEGLCIFENTKEDHNAQNNLNWTENPVATSDAIIAENMEVNGPLTVNSMTINEGVTVIVKNGAVLTIGDGDSFREQAGNLHIENGGKVVLTTGELIVNDFILDAALGMTDEQTTTASTSGQITSESQITVKGDAYFRLAVDPSGHNTLGWYDFVVPFPVDVIGGISIAEDPTAVMQFNVNYAVMNYDEAKNAQRGKHWNKFTGTMLPGRAYTITLDETKPWNTVVFKKKAGEAVTGYRSFTTEYSGLGATKDNGWNGFGNGTLHHTELNVAPGTLIQLYDHAHRCYQPREAKDYTIAVGLSFFMQFDRVETVNLLAAEGNGTNFRAPERAISNVEKFRLALTAEDAINPADYIWVSASEEATDEYIIGRDVLKMGSMNESTVARMWTTRAGMGLCSNEMPLVDNIAQCALGLYAPQARTYTIAVEEAPQDANLYLTYNDQVIWDLTLGAYTIDLAKGKTTGYGLRIEARTPQVATGIESTATDTNSARKVMINNTLYVVTPEGEMYDITGKFVK